MNAMAQTVNALFGENPTLEDVLGALQRYGKPRMQMMDQGWMCAIDMHVSSVGASFTVRSEFDSASPLLAAKQCHERVLKTLRELGV